MEAYEDDIEDVTEGDGSSNVIKELKRFTGLYALGSTIFSTPIDCQELTVVDVSSIHHMWVRWCNCQMPGNIKKSLAANQALSSQLQKHQVYFHIQGTR